MLLEEFLIPMELTQRQLADAIHVPYQRVNELVNGKRGVTPGTALRLAKYFGTSPDFWLNLQMRWDVYFAQQAEAAELAVIEPLSGGSAESTLFFWQTWYNLQYKPEGGHNANIAPSWSLSVLYLL